MLACSGYSTEAVFESLDEATKSLIEEMHSSNLHPDYSSCLRVVVIDYSEVI